MIILRLFPPFPFLVCYGVSVKGKQKEGKIRFLVLGQTLVFFRRISEVEEEDFLLGSRSSASMEVASEGDNQNKNDNSNTNNNNNYQTPNNKVNNSNEGQSKPKRQMKTPFQLETLEKAYACMYNSFFSFFFFFG